MDSAEGVFLAALEHILRTVHMPDYGRDAETGDLSAAAASETLPILPPGVFGRILFADSAPARLDTYTPDGQEPVPAVFAVGGETLALLASCPVLHLLLSVGWPLENVWHEVEQGKRYFITMFGTQLQGDGAGRGRLSATRADWAGVRAIVADTMSSAVAEAALPHIEALAAGGPGTSWDELEADAGFPFDDTWVDMDPERRFTYDGFETYVALADAGRLKLWHTRLLLYRKLFLNALYRGDGFTWSAEGVRFAPEYLVQEACFDTLEHVRILDVTAALKFPEIVATPIADGDGTG